MSASCRGSWDLAFSDFDAICGQFGSAPHGAAYAQAKLFCRRSSEGDVVLVLENQQVIGIGVVMSEVLFDEHRGLHCAVEWQRVSPSKPFQWGKLSKRPIARLVGGGLAVVDALLR